MFGFCLHPHCDCVFEYDEGDRYFISHHAIHAEQMTLHFRTENCARAIWNQASAINFFAKYYVVDDEEPLVLRSLE